MTANFYLPGSRVEHSTHDDAVIVHLTERDGGRVTFVFLAGRDDTATAEAIAEALRAAARQAQEIGARRAIAEAVPA